MVSAVGHGRPGGLLSHGLVVLGLRDGRRAVAGAGALTALAAALLGLSAAQGESDG